MKRGVRLPSGRVIALGRLLLATVFTLAASLGGTENSPPSEAIALSTYMVFASVVVWITWRDWWVDAKLAGPAHTVDIALFTFLLTSSAGYTSPYFTFFIFLLLSAAIRWGWRATTLTAVLVGVLYLFAGQVVAGTTGALATEPFVIRMGHLIILSLILIWFGVNHWQSGFDEGLGDLLPDPTLDSSPLEASLEATMKSTGARKGAFVWQSNDRTASEAWVANDGSIAVSDSAPRIGDWEAPVLYDLVNDRALSRDPQRSLRPHDAREIIIGDTASALHLKQGIAIPVRSGTGRGELFLEEIPDLSVDHLNYGERLALDVAAHIQRHALLRAVEESAEARSRLMLARDLHDSVVQFLAGAAFRIEALKRNDALGRDLEPELNELKKLMLKEQDELRAFIAALRSGSQVELAALAEDLRQLAGKLARQWDIMCRFTAEHGDMIVPSRLQLDAQQLLREAVANAVRHAGAKSMTIRLEAEDGAVLLDFINDGAPFPTSPLDGELPRSMRERVEQAGGTMELSRGMGMTKISVSLPIWGSNP